MADEYALSMLKISLAQLCQNVGFQGATNVSLSVLLDIYRRYMESMCKTLHRYCDHFGRTEPVLEDVETMFGELRIPLRELLDYVNQVAPVPFKHKVPLFPVQRPSKLKMPPADSEELLTRPDHIPPHLPLMKPEAEPSLTAAAQEQNAEISGGEQDGKSMDDSSAGGRLNAARISVHRATISSLGKQDLSQCSDLIGDFSDFDAIKAGLVRIVRIPTPPPPPPRPPSPSSAPYAVAMSPSASASAPTTVATAPLIKVAEEKSSKKRQPTVLDVRPPEGSRMGQSSILSPHPKLKINLPSVSAYKKKRLMPTMVQKKEKQKFKVLPPLKPGLQHVADAGSAEVAPDVPAVPKRRGRPPGSGGRPKKLAVAMAAASAATASASTPASSIGQMEKVMLDFSSSSENPAVADVLASISSLDTSTATSSSVEDLVTSVIEETRNTIKAKEKASEHFADSVMSVISLAQADVSPGQPQLSQKTEESNPLLAGAGGVSLLFPRKEPVVLLPRLDMEELDLKPSTSRVAASEPEVGPGELSKADKLKTILQRTRLFVNKDVIKLRLKEKSARKEAEEKKIRDVVEKTYPPIAKREEEVAPAPPPLIAQPAVPTPAAPVLAPAAALVLTPAAVPASTPESIPTLTPAAMATEPALELAAKPPRRPPGIPPTSIRASASKSKPVIGRSSKLDLSKKTELFPPLFQPEHITKTIITSAAAAADNRKVAPLVISTKSKSATDAHQASGAPSPNVELAAAKKESTKLIIKLPHHPPAAAATAGGAGDEKEKERKRKHHHEKEKEKQKEKREKTRHPPPTLPPFVLKKEKKVQEPKAEIVPTTSTKTLETGDVGGGVSAVVSSPKVLKLKINMKSKVVTPTAPASEKESKVKEKKAKSIVESGLAKATASPQHSTALAESVANKDYEDVTRSALLTPPPKSPSAHSKSPSHPGSIGGSVGVGGYESPPPRTPSPGSSAPPSPIYVTTHSSEEKIIKEEVVSPPAKKQKTDHWPETPEPPPPRNVIKIDKSQFTMTVAVPSTSQPKREQQTGGRDNGWYCPVCNVPYEEGADMIACDECDRWFHWACVGLLQAPPENENWYCQQCRVRKASGSSKQGSGSVAGGNRRKQQKPSLQKKKK